MDTPRVFKVVASCYTWTIVALDGLEALGEAQDLHLRAERKEAKEYPGFPLSFSVECQGTIDSVTPLAKEEI